MLLDLFLKYWATPENIIGLILDILPIVSMCLIFHVWKEKWWKSLIPVYGTYLLYKHTWKKKCFVFWIPLIFSIVSSRCMAFLRKDIASDVFFAIETYLESEQIALDIDMTQFIICIVIFLFGSLIHFIFTRITYWKVCNTLQINNRLLKIGTFLFPQIFLLVDYIFYKKSAKQ